MALTDKIKSLLNSPKGKQAMERGRQELSKPENQQKIKNLLNKGKKR
jgi:UDP-N-acetylglucosamine:LPS N-acetylglucosamine transferase